MKTLYFDCFAGASGDMLLGALVSAGVDPGRLSEQLQLLDVSGFDLRFETVDRSGISSVKAHVGVPEEHAHRHLHHIEKIIGDSRLPGPVKERAVRIFTRLAEAEAKVHGIPVSKVHFHEVGAMDAIIDVVGACIGFEMLGIERFACSKIHVGSGFVNMAHGKFPVPPPAVAELLADIPVYSTEIVGELITPTGAAIISTVCQEYGKLPEMRTQATGYGAGTRDFKDFPNVLRIMIGDSAAQREAASRELLVLETNLDDVSPEILGFVMEKALAEGALDCWFTPIQMKKNRPATLLSVLCIPEERDRFVELLVRETPTLGIRISTVERFCLDREMSAVLTRFGEIPVKVARFEGRVVNAKPEFETLREIATREGIPLRDVESEVMRKLSDV